MVNRGSRGHALLVALVVLTLVASALTLLLAHLGLRARLVSQEARRIQLVALNDAAVAEALASLAAKPGWRGISEHRFGSGLIRSRVRHRPDDRAEITAIASYRGWQRRTTTVVRLTPSGPRVVSWTALPPGTHGATPSP